MITTREIDGWLAKGRPIISKSEIDVGLTRLTGLSNAKVHAWIGYFEDVVELLDA